MSRASNVYILQQREDGLILAGWTVKREMVYWLSHRDESPEWLKENYQIVRCRDSHGTENTTIVPWEEIKLTLEK